MTLLFTNPLFERHETGDHPENPARLRAILDRLHQTGLSARCPAGTFQPLSEEALTDIHETRLVAGVRDLAENGGGFLGLDTVVSPRSYDVALAAAGACVAAVDQVLKGEERTALCLVRPPGHHATPAHSMGFCLFNNVALAAHHAKRKHRLSRVLIVDWDTHHGNGTQEIFFEDPEVMFLSIHRYGSGFYPGSGGADETGLGRGVGFTINVPIRFGTSRKEYLNHFAKGLEKAAHKIRPELVLVSGGYDAHALDPIGPLGLEEEDFATLTRMVREVAQTHAGGRLVSTLEGGYHLAALAGSVQAHVEELLAGPGK